MSTNQYMREYMSKRYFRRKAEAIKRLGGKCSRCGSTKDLQFDHVSPESKAFTFGKRLAGVSRERFEEELPKCQLLCQECHSAKTCEDLGLKLARGTHGTLSSYRYCGPPKCVLCRAAKADAQRRSRSA